MYQYDDATAIASLPAPAAPGTAGYFTDGNPSAATPATILRSDFMNMVMMELLNIVTAGGVVPSKTTYNQVLAAIENLIEVRSANYSVDTGAANAYVIALAPAVVAYTNGLTARFKIAHTNTGASTLNAGGGAVPLLNNDGGALVVNDLPAGMIVTVTYDSTAAAFLITALVPSQVSLLANGVKTGDLIFHAGTSAPAGTLACPLTPTNVSVGTYTALAQVLGITWGNGATTAAGAFVNGTAYVIVSIGTTDFTLIGAASNTIGMVFTATGAGAGTGTAASTFGIPNFPADYALVQANANVGTQTVGAVIAHTHSFGTGNNAAAGAAEPVPAGGSNFVINSTGGTANLAAGSRVLICVKY